MKTLRRVLSYICIIDKFLIIFMFLLLLQSFHVLFSQNAVVGEPGTVDIAIRTSAAAIFGYFLSGNFSRGIQSRSVSAVSTLNDISHEAPKNSMGFSSSNTTVPGYSDVSYGDCQRLQTIIVACVGIISLVILIVARDCSLLSSVTSPIVSQLRDFVSASIGYLISCGKSKSA